MSRKLTRARREVERLRLEAKGVGHSEINIWEASNRVEDLEIGERQAAVRTARNAGRIMDAVLLIVALLTMAFSLQNIHDFAAGHGVQDPIAWFLAPAVDLALLAALMGDAVLSRWQLDAGPWAVHLRWYAGGATLVLNTWESVARLDVASILLHAVPPVLLFVLAEAASPYRVQFAETVRLAAVQVDAEVVVAPAAGPENTVGEPVPALEPGGVDDPPVSTRSAQVAAVEPLRAVPAPAEVNIPSERLDAKEARAAIENSWEQGLTIREAAALATRSTSYVQGVYAQLTKSRGGQPAEGQTASAA